MNNDMEQDEITLYEIFLILKKRFKYILFIFIAGTILSTLIAYTLPNIYESQAIITSNVEFYKSYTRLYDYLTKKGVDNKLITFNINTNNLIKIGYGNNYINNILDSIELKDAVVKALKSKNLGNNINKELKSLELQVESGNKEALYTSKVQDNAIIVISDQKNKELAKDILDETLNLLNHKINEVSKTSKNYDLTLRVLQKPTVLDKPVKPKRKLIVVVSSILSLFLGIFVAFLVEAISNQKN